MTNDTNVCNIDAALHICCFQTQINRMMIYDSELMLCVSSRSHIINPCQTKTSVVNKNQHVIYKLHTINLTYCKADMELT